jgi:beta-glucanase (GH16 family)
MKWPNTTTGSWPALWMLPVGQSTGATTGENGGEIDIMEGQGGASPNTTFGTVHNWVNGVDVSNNEGSNAYTFPKSVNLSQYHVYGVLWTPGQVSWYFDNEFLYSASFPDPAYPAYGTEPYYLILANQEGVEWDFGDLSGVRSRDMQMQVDWVHVWQLP